jgi:hypothetical protein
MVGFTNECYLICSRLTSALWRRFGCTLGCSEPTYAIRCEPRPKYSRSMRSRCSCSAISIFFLAFSKLPPRTMTDSLSQTPLQPSSSSQKLQSSGMPAITGRETASLFIESSSSRLLFATSSHQLSPNLVQSRQGNLLTFEVWGSHTTRWLPPKPRSSRVAKRTINVEICQSYVKICQAGFRSTNCFIKEGCR